MGDETVLFQALLLARRRIGGDFHSFHVPTTPLAFSARGDGAGAVAVSGDFGGWIAFGGGRASNVVLSTYASQWEGQPHRKRPVWLALFRARNGAHKPKSSARISPLRCD
jgi:phage tail tape-measure protein